MNKLKPCPFCGCRADVWQAYDGYWAVECSVCYARAYYANTKKDAIKRWNMRKNDG